MRSISNERVLKELKETKKVVVGVCNSWMAMEECAKYLCISKNSLYAMVSKQAIPCYRIGKRIVFNTVEVDDWMKINCRIKPKDEIAMEVNTDILTSKHGKGKR